MIINRHNYEEVFMLYADNELSAAEKQAVEQFVAANIDLKAEFDLIQQLVLHPEEDTISFFQKELLYKSETDEITATNAEEHFLLYIDKELTAKQKIQVETFVLQNPALQENFTQLKQAVLPVETMLCPDKASLYKKEERPVVYLWMRRLAVAAIFFVLAISVWMLAPSNSSNTVATDVTAKEQTSSPVKTNEGVKKEIIKQEANKSIPNNKPLTETNSNNNFAATVKKLREKSNTIVSPSVTQERAQIIDPREAVVVTEAETLKKVVSQEKTESNNHTVETRTNEIARVAEKNTGHANEETEVETGYAKQTAYKELDTDDERKTLYVGAIEINKDKIRGFFRKAGSIFKSKTRAEEDKLQVASFAINTKNPK